MLVSRRLIYFIAEVILFSLLIIMVSCDSEDSVLPPYAGSPVLSNINVEQGTFKPKITWSGGYISVIGANRGGFARLDSSLIWLVKTEGNKITYPISFGEVPNISQNLLGNYNGSQLDKLDEDLLFTYWVLKEDAWGLINSHNGKVLMTDSTLDEGNIRIESDTLRISQKSFALKSQPIDLFPNISEILLFGRLGEIKITQAKDDRGPIISWRITQAGVTDTLISAIGLVKGQQYSAQYIMWEMWSQQTSSGGNIYGKLNIISAPLYLGENRPDTRTFTEFNPATFERDSYYYLWIANQNWNGTARTRVTNNYAFATFKTW